MPLNPNIALGATQPQQQQNPFGMLAQLLQIQQLIQKGEQERQLMPLQMRKLEAEIANIPAQEEQRRAAAAAATLKLQNDAMQAQGRQALANYNNPQSQYWSNQFPTQQPLQLAGSESEALARFGLRMNPDGTASPINKDNSGVVTAPMNVAAQNPKVLESLLSQADPAAYVRGKMTAMNRPPERPQVVGPGAALMKDGQVIHQQPFAPRTEMVVVQTPEGPRYAPRAEAAGQPAPPTNATRDPKAQAAYNAGLRELQKDDAAVAQTAQLEQALNRWKELNAEVETGRISGLRPQLMQPMLQELNQLQSYLAVNNFKPGQGQISNFERQLIKGAGPTVTNDRETNERIIAIQLGGVQNFRDRAAFREWYLENKGNLLGSDKAWGEYIEKNPRYKKGERGAILPNTDRKEWMEYFGAPRTQGNEEPPPARRASDNNNDPLGIRR